MTNRALFRISVCVLSVAAVGALALSLRARPKVPKPYPAKRSLFAAYHLQGEAQLILSNSSAEQVSITPEVYSEDGQPQELEAIVLQSHEQTMMRLGERIRSLGPSFRRGGMKLEFETADLRDLFVQNGSPNFFEHADHWHLRFP